MYNLQLTGNFAECVCRAAGVEGAGAPGSAASGAGGILYGGTDSAVPVTSNNKLSISDRIRSFVKQNKKIRSQPSWRLSLSRIFWTDLSLNILLLCKNVFISNSKSFDNNFKSNRKITRYNKAYLNREYFCLVFCCVVFVELLFGWSNSFLQSLYENFKSSYKTILPTICASPAVTRLSFDPLRMSGYPAQVLLWISYRVL